MWYIYILYTSTKQDLSLEEVLNLGIVMFCVGAQSGASVSGFGPVNFRHASQEDSQGPQLHVSLQVQQDKTRHSLSRVKHGLILRPQNLKTFQFTHHQSPPVTWSSFRPPVKLDVFAGNYMIRLSGATKPYLVWNYMLIEKRMEIYKFKSTVPPCHFLYVNQFVELLLC